MYFYIAGLRIMDVFQFCAKKTAYYGAFWTEPDSNHFNYYTIL